MKKIPNNAIIQIDETGIFNTVKEKYKSQKKYISENIKVIRFSLNKKYDIAIIDYLNSVKNKQDYLKELIKNDMLKNK